MLNEKLTTAQNSVVPFTNREIQELKLLLEEKNLREADKRSILTKILNFEVKIKAKYLLALAGLGLVASKIIYDLLTVEEAITTEPESSWFSFAQEYLFSYVSGTALGIYSASNRRWNNSVLDQMNHASTKLKHKILNTNLGRNLADKATDVPILSMLVPTVSDDSDFTITVADLSTQIQALKSKDDPVSVSPDGIFISSRTLTHACLSMRSPDQLLLEKTSSNVRQHRTA